jgi:hypothetical protein
MSCAHVHHPAITQDGSYCCEEATKVASHKLYFEPLGKTGLEIEKENLNRDLRRGVRGA